MLNVTVTDISEAEFKNSFEVYPNPNKGMFTVEFNITAKQNIQFSVKDITGREIYNKRVSGHSGLFQEELELDCAPGVYSLEVWSDSFSINRKLIIKQ